MKKREGVYTAKQVMELLHLEPSQISRLVQKGILMPVYQTGYTHKYYDKLSVDTYYGEYTAFNERHKESIG